MNGIVDSYNSARGFGFILPLVGKPDTTAKVFFHVSALVGSKSESVPVGAEVKFVLTRGARGPQAADVELVRLSGAALISQR